MGLNTKNLDVGFLDCISHLLVGIRVCVLGSLRNRENTHDLDSVSWGALIGEISVNCEEK